MTNLLQVWSSVDPRELQINKRYRNSQRLNPWVRAAQDQLIYDIKSAIPKYYQPCLEDCAVRLTFIYPDRRSDIDGSIKRTLDAIEKALKAKGYKWHDGKINQLTVVKALVDPRTYTDPGIGISML